MYRSMPPRPRGKMHRGGMRGGYGGGHWERGHGGRGGGGGGYRGRGRGGGPRGGRPDYYHGHGRRGSRSPPPRQHHDHEKLLAGLGPEAQLALTTAIINSVLKTDGREGRGSYRERDRIHHRDARRDGRGGYFREESRERRHYGDERRSHDPRQYHEEGRGHRYEREKSTSGSPRYRNNRYSGMPRRRPSPHGHPGPSRKRQRVERMDSGEGGSTPHHEHEFEGEEEVYDQERERERPRERRHRSPGDEEQRKGREGEGSKDEDDKEGSDGRGGVQVTIRADGERAVNSEGHVRSRVSGRIFVDLKCPHCPSQKSITFKEYKFHLGSDGHKNQLNRLARKHSVVLRKIRIQQRQEQRDIEEKWKEDKGEEFKNAVSKFCSTCKLAFKCLGSNVSDGISLHSRSKLHRMQRHYLHPRCGICRITFPSRMVYEYHIASINHLRVRTATVDNHGGDHRSDEHDDEDDDDALDLTNFMTLDSVGEDDEEVGSEHEEITEGLEEVEAAEEGSIRKTSSKSTKRKKGQEEEEISVEADWDKEQLDEDEDEEGNEAVGTEYVNRIEAYFCSLCCKIIRGGTSLGSRSVQRHCRSYDHLAHYQDAHPPKAEEKQEASADEGEDKLDNANVEDKEEVVKTKEHKEVDHEPEEGDYEGEEGDYEAEEEDFEGEEGDYDGEEDVDEGEEEADEGEAGEADEGEAEEADEGEAEEADNLEDPTDDDPEQEKLWKEVDKGLTELQGEIMNEIGEKSQDEKMDVDHHAEVEEESGNEEENEGNDSENQQNHSEDEEEVENVEENKEAEVDDDGADDGDDDDDNDHAESQSAVEERKEVGNGSDSE